MLLLDTSVLVELKALLIPASAFALSAVSYAELKFGIEASPNETERQVRELRLLELESYGFQWLPFDRAAGDGYGKVAARIALTRPAHARSKDAMLAGHAYALGASIATLNPKDFEASLDLVPIVVPQRRR
ncbi:MAG: PIN domain-containing protein [Microbacterium sp.]